LIFAKGVQAESIWGNKLLVIGFFQKVAGITVFSLLLIQTIWIILGKKLNRLFFTQGLVIYFLILVHIFLLVFYNFKARGVLDVFYPFTDLCLLCQGRYELLMTLGRLAFWLITAQLFITSLRKYPFLNYLAFFFVALHGIFLGGSQRPSFLVLYYWVSTFLVLGLMVVKLVKRLRPSKR